ncbi:MFS transporter [Peptoniphilus sp. KCTC 25270]|uniref:MFS transporter n=1 Tax=Peptoniphilus sp. KCTC 25270 TaxID=2897414 RepID=UPI001E43F604|nr:MFS transporter [Peptoniphilus sp. KCTC 25270]MCD1147562.1 MFS transporter [Peptoniphilus sp. KCTC 25270]
MTQKISKNLFYIMAFSTTIAILSEMAPSGVLLQMTRDLGISESSGGLFIGMYAFAAALFAIPVVTWTMKMDRKRLLQWIVAVLGISNLAISFLSSFEGILFFRLLSGMASGSLWPIMSAYGSKMVSREEAGSTIATIMSGGPIGLLLGVPALTYLGNSISWRWEFRAIALLSLFILWMVERFLPSVPGEIQRERKSLFQVLSHRDMAWIGITNFIVMMGFYILYVYIEPLAQHIHYPAKISVAQLIYGVATFISIQVVVKWVEKRLNFFINLYVILPILSMLLFLFVDRNLWVHSLAFFLWGASYGPLSSLFQTAIARRIPEDRETGNAIQSSVFSFGSMAGSVFGGMILGIKSIETVIWCALALFVVSLLMIWARKETFAP